jgi:hypothetical protein
MTRACCPPCRLRFSPAVAVSLVACPQCGDELHEPATAAEVIGFRLMEQHDVLDAQVLANALAVALPAPRLDN